MKYGRARFVAGVLLTTASWACGSDGPAAPAPIAGYTPGCGELDDTPPCQAPRPGDGSPSGDGGVAAPPDGGDATAPDGAAGGDAATPTDPSVPGNPGSPGTPAEPGQPVALGSCTLTPGEVQRMGLGDTLTPALAAGASAGALAWPETRIGVTDLFVQVLTPEGEATQSVNVSAARSLVRGAALAATSDGWLAGWFDNRTDGYEVYVRALGVDGTPVGEAQRLTDNDVRDDAPALLHVTGGALAAWVEQRDDDTRVARTRRLDVTGAPQGAARDVTAAPYSPSELRLASVGERPALAWAESSLAYVLRLKGDGSADGAPALLNDEHDAAGGVDLAGTPTGGGAVFTALVGSGRQEVHFRALDDSGAPVGRAQPLTRGARQGASPSVTPFQGGYAVAYRAFGDLDTPSLLLALLSSEGTLLAELRLAGAARQGPPPLVRATADGSLFVGWGEDGQGLSALHLACHP